MPMALGLGLGLPYLGAARGPYPALDLNFIAMAASGVLDPRITFSRGSLATLTNAAGAVAYAPHNLLTYSQDLTNAAWVKSAMTPTYGVGPAPDGASTASQLLEVANSVAHLSSSQQTFTAAPYTLSIYAKPIGRQWCRLMIYDGTSFKFAYFDLVGAVAGTTSAGVTASISSEANGFFRLSIKYTCAAGTGSAFFHGALADNGVDTYAGDITKGYCVWGAQLNIGPLQPYYPTTSSAYHGPRFTYDPVTHASLGLLIEEQRTNAFLWSNDISNAWWTLTGATAVGGNVAPDGTSTAYKLTENSSTSEHKVGRASAVSCSSGVVHTISFRAKAAGRSGLRLYVYGFNNYTPFIDLSTKSVVSSTGGTAPTVKFRDSADGYVRVEITDTTTAPELQFDGIGLVSTGTTFNYLGDGSSGVLLWGLQREVGAFATSDIPTTSATVTRSADSATMTGANFSSWFNATMGTLSCDSTFVSGAQSAAVMVPFSANNASANGYMLYKGFFSGTLTPIYDAGTLPNVLAALPGDGRVKFAMTYSATAAAACANAGSVKSSAGALSVAAPSQLQIGRAVAGYQFSGTIARIRYYPTALTNAQLQALTT